MVADSWFYSYQRIKKGFGQWLILFGKKGVAGQNVFAEEPHLQAPHPVLTIFFFVELKIRFTNATLECTGLPIKFQLALLLGVPWQTITGKFMNWVLNAMQSRTYGTKHAINFKIHKKLLNYIEQSKLETWNKTYKR